MSIHLTDRLQGMMQDGRVTGKEGQELKELYAKASKTEKRQLDQFLSEAAKGTGDGAEALAKVRLSKQLVSMGRGPGVIHRLFDAKGAACLLGKEKSPAAATGKLAEKADTPATPTTNKPESDFELRPRGSVSSGETLSIPGGIFGSGRASMGDLSIGPKTEGPNRSYAFDDSVKEHWGELEATFHREAKEHHIPKGNAKGHMVMDASGTLTQVIVTARNNRGQTVRLTGLEQRIRDLGIGTVAGDRALEMDYPFTFSPAPKPKEVFVSAR